MCAKVLLLNGPNLNLLGTREPEKYGTETLDDVVNRAKSQCESKNLLFEAFQTNHEGIMLDKIHSAKQDGTKFIIINAGAWTHTSVALVDALSGVDIPFIEVHVRKIGVGLIDLISANMTNPLHFRSPIHTNEKNSDITLTYLQKPLVSALKDTWTPSSSVPNAQILFSPSCAIGVILGLGT